MDAAKEEVADGSLADTVKLNEPICKPVQEEGKCHISNGVEESGNGIQSEAAVDVSSVKESAPIVEAVAAINHEEEKSDKNVTQELSENSITNTAEHLHPVTEDSPLVEVQIDQELVISEEVVESGSADNSKVLVEEEVVETAIVEIAAVETAVEATSNDQVRFETEVLVETNDNDVDEIEISVSKESELDATNNMLSDLNQSIELSEALRSSDVTDNVENNNCTQEVFNKEELLDILEGKEDSHSTKDAEKQSEYPYLNKSMETKLALKQLSRLKQLKGGRRSSNSTPKKKHSKKNDEEESIKIIPKKKRDSKEESAKLSSKKKDESKSKEERVKVASVKDESNMEGKDEKNKEDSIVTALVRDWEDDEVPEDEPLPSVDKVPLQNIEQKEESNVKVEKRNSTDSVTSDCQNSSLNKSDDSQPHRRLGRVIKKKVIFDPDNPDTFTKRKSFIKHKGQAAEKEQPPTKKSKVVVVVSPRAKSKSPVLKKEWKKPSLKQSKQNKRLSEVDKLLMDEGAVNMIYQLTPEAPKGRKNMRTKAEFIKKLQSSTPEGKEMKFRERKKELLKGENCEPKHILSGKQRSSLSSSVKSPSMCEDFENHSADDSIIYRRHSSSSYSSTCMTPRRLSDVETINNQSAIIAQQSNDAKLDSENNTPDANVFQKESKIAKDIINKDDCLSIKKKLNSKLSLALNKRKREANKTEKLPKKLQRLDKSVDQDNETFKWLSIIFDQRVAEICIYKKGPKYNIEVLKEMTEALSYIDMNAETSITLITSDCGTLCSELDLRAVLHDDHKERTKAANNALQTVRGLLMAVEQHSKMLFLGAWGACSGLALPLLVLADVSLVAEGAVFGLPGLTPGMATFMNACRRLPLSLVNDLMIFGRQLSSNEALQNGLVSRVLCNAGFHSQVQAVVKEVAEQPIEALLLKKKMMKLLKTPLDSFLSVLDSELALLSQYWASDEGQAMIRDA